MMKMSFSLTVVTFLIFLGGCGKSSTTATAPAAAPAKTLAPEGSKEERKSPFDFLRENQYREIYSPTGKHDPFRIFEGGEVIYSGEILKAPLERFELNQFQLTGIVWGIARPKILLRAPDGYSYIAQVGSGIGRNRGKITKITKNKVLVMEEYRDPTGKYITRESEFVISSDPKQDKKNFKEMELKYSDE